MRQSWICVSPSPSEFLHVHHHRGRKVALYGACPALARFSRGFECSPGGSIARARKSRSGFIRDAATKSSLLSTRCRFHFTSPRQEAMFLFLRPSGIRRIEIGLPPGVEVSSAYQTLGRPPGDVLRISRAVFDIRQRKDRLGMGLSTRHERTQRYHGGYSNMYQFPYLSTPAETYGCQSTRSLRARRQ